jgi:hypothetical protein
MKTPFAAPLIAVALIGSIVASPPAHASTKADQVIILTGSNATLGIGDLNAPGPTPGDIRTLSLALTNAKNQPAGRAEIVQTLTRQSASDGTAVKVVVLTLPRGIITGIGQSDFTNFTDPQGRPKDLFERLAITGGTGAYRGASGQIDVTVLPNFASKWTISLDK